MDLGAFSKQLNLDYTRLRARVDKKVRDYDWRMEQLHQLKKLIEENDAALCEAMWKDLHKSKFECTLSEQGVVLSEIEVTLQNLKKWMKPQRASTPLYSLPGSSRIVHEPFGLTLIIGAWNYPINLLLGPLVGAIAGGNSAFIKPSEIAANTAKVIGELVPQYLDPDSFAVIQGGPQETDLLLDHKFDLIFFTGSGTVGKIILAKAALHLTPVVLELGGKSPAVVKSDADIVVAARRIAWGKFINAGQTCVAPDFVIIDPKVKELFLSEVKKSLHEFFGEDVSVNPDYCRMVNQRNFDRVMKLSEGLKTLHGGQSDREKLFIAPTVVAADEKSKIMQEEIFGPILPILEMDDDTQIIDFIRSKDKPLALYVFTKDPAVFEHYVSLTSSGSICLNDDVIHMPIPTLPFGGVGASGMGNYHGEFSFKTFTHAKGVLRKSFFFDAPVRYPPYSSRKERLMQWLFS
jgi:aldehyde dehydrogenase (NAD+)